MKFFKKLFKKQSVGQPTIQQPHVCFCEESKQLSGKPKEPTITERLHDSYYVQLKIEDIISEAFEKYESEVSGNPEFDFSIGSDHYDNSIEIYFNFSLPYPYEPCKEIRDIIYNLGFSIVYWNFSKDAMDVFCDRLIGEESKIIKNSRDEIRGWEPRHNRNAHWIANKYGYVDDRFNEKEWESKYNFRGNK